MSVQFSELTTRLNMSDIKRPSVRRCLFGRPDPEKVSKDLQIQAKIFYEEDAKRFREKWSFDPITGPLEGGKFQYEVMAVDSSSDSIPSFYTKIYASRKSRHVRTIRERSLCSATDSGRPVSAKRKLDLESQENDENEVVDKRVPNKGDVIVNASLVVDELSSSCVMVVPDSGENSCSRLCGLPAGLAAHISSTSSLPELSPTSRNKDIMTPPSRPKCLVQSSVKDYLPTKKQRMLITKALPRT